MTMMPTTVTVVITVREQVQESVPGSISPALPAATRRTSRSAR